MISSACSDMRWPRGTHTRSRIMHARAFRWEKERRERRTEWEGQKLVQTFHFAVRRACRERGLIFLFNSRNEIALVKSTGIFLFAMPSPLFLRANAAADCCATRVEVARVRKFEIHVISTCIAFVDSVIYM